MPVSRKVIEQIQKAGARVAQMKRTPREMDNSLSDKHKQDDYITDESQDSQSNGEANLDEMKDLNIGS